MDLSEQRSHRRKLTFVISYANEFGGIQTVNELLLNMLVSSGKYDIILLSAGMLSRRTGTVNDDISEVICRIQSGICSDLDHKGDDA